MYAGAAGHVDAEEYLTGRAVDKTFEQFKLGGAEPIGLGIILTIIIYFSSCFNHIVFLLEFQIYLHQLFPETSL